jgi:hypothetical protein
VFKAVKFSKIRVREGLGEFRLASVIKPNEDFLTAAVFARLLYLPPDAFAALLPVFVGRLGKVQESAFWPTWSVKSGSGEVTRVEPDVYVEFENLDLIVEAKLNDEPGGQTPEQWAWEWAAWHQAEYASVGKPALLLGIGGLGMTDKATKAAAMALVETANGCLKNHFPEIPPIQAAGLSWQQLYDRLTSERLNGQVSSQLVQDLREILGYFGLRRFQYLGDLSGTMRKLMIDAIGLDCLEVVSRWHTAQREPDWLEASQGLRPIWASSIGIFGRRVW